MTATVTIPLPRFATYAFVPYACFVVAVALLFGGGTRQGFWSDAVVQLSAMPLLAWALLRLQLSQLSRSARWSIVLLCAIVAVPLIQIIPMPPAYWRSLPGREEIASAYQAAGTTLPWLPISLDPASTWRSLLSLIPAVAVFLAMLSIRNPGRRFLVALVLAIAFVSIAVDLLQMMGGPDSPLRFYAITNPDRAVGFFANANHNAAFLFCAIPFAAAWLTGLVQGHHRYRNIGLLLLSVLLACVFIGLALTRSRAGLALGFAAGLCSLGLIWRHSRAGSLRRVLFVGLAANVAALLMAFQFGFVAIATRVEHSDIMADLRWPVAQITARAALSNFPYGTGLGTFVPIYQMNVPRTLVYDRFVNRAHDDWLELWLTGGAPALVVVLGFLALFVIVAVRAWHGWPGSPVLDVVSAQAASIMIVLLLLHSILDYPLRTAAVASVFALACALLIPPVTQVEAQ